MCTDLLRPILTWAPLVLERLTERSSTSGLLLLIAVIHASACTDGYVHLYRSRTSLHIVLIASQQPSRTPWLGNTCLTSRSPMGLLISSPSLRRALHKTLKAASTQVRDCLCCALTRHSTSACCGSSSSRRRPCHVCTAIYSSNLYHQPELISSIGSNSSMQECMYTTSYWIIHHGDPCIACSLLAAGQPACLSVDFHDLLPLIVPANITDIHLTCCTSAALQRPVTLMLSTSLRPSTVQLARPKSTLSSGC